MVVKKQLRMVALLRGVNVGGNKKVPMKALVQVALDCGFTEVATYIQSGNLLFNAGVSTAEAETKLEKAIEARFGFQVEVIVRSAAQWNRYAAGTPFTQAQHERPNLVLLGLSKKPPKADAAKLLRERATQGELIEIQGDAVWVDFPAGVGVSKLTPAVMDRAVGSTVTARNWKTVQQLAQML